MPAPAQLHLEADRSVVIIRSFSAPRSVIWQAFTKPSILTHWLLGPPGWKMDLCQISLEPGGGYLWRWRCTQSGKVAGFRGTYSVVEPGKRLIDKQVFEHGGQNAGATVPTKNRAIFEDDGRGCCVVTTVRYPDAATRDGLVAQGLCDGMEASYQRLDSLLLRAAA